MSLFNKDSDPLADQDSLARHIKIALRMTAPSGLQLDLSYQIIKRLLKPTIVGAEHIPDRPCLFVGNHSLFALDGAVIMPLFLKELHRFPRGMGDRFLFGNRLVADFLLSNGLVMGHPEVCTALMADKQDVLVFPGGAYEAVKPASKRYELQWKERYGFVKMAAMHGYTIMPFGLVGPDEFYDHLIEGQDLPDSPLGRLLKSMGLLTDDIRSDILPPIPVGSLGTLFPKPQRCYLGFGQPINLARYKGKAISKKSLQSIRSAVAAQVELQLADLLVLREQHRGQNSLLRRLLTL